MSYQTEVLADSPRNFWPMLDDLNDLGHTPTTLTAVFGNVQDEPAPEAGQFARRPSGSQLSFRPSTQFDINAARWSIEVWYKARATSSGDTALIGSWGSSAGAMLYVTDGGAGFPSPHSFVRDGLNHDSGLPLITGEWEHWVMTFDIFTDLRIVYRNGIEVLRVTDTVDGVFSRSTWGIGEYNVASSTARDASMCYAAVWLDRALTADRVLAHWNAMGYTPAQPTIPSAHAYTAAVLADTPEAYYEMREPAASTVLADSSGNGHHGVIAGSPSFGQTGLLDCVSDDSIQLGSGRIAVPDHSNFLSQQITLEAWSVWGAPTQDARMLWHSGDGGSPLTHSRYRWAMWHSTTGSWDTYLRYGAAQGDVVTVSILQADLNDGEPHHWVTTYDGTTAIVYLDGVEYTRVTDARTLIDQRGALSIGWWNEGSCSDPWNTRAGHLAMYRSVLSAARVLAHYEAGMACGGPAWQIGVVGFQ